MLVFQECLCGQCLHHFWALGIASQGDLIKGWTSFLMSFLMPKTPLNASAFFWGDSVLSEIIFSAWGHPSVPGYSFCFSIQMTSENGQQQAVIKMKPFGRNGPSAKLWWVCPPPLNSPVGDFFLFPYRPSSLEVPLHLESPYIYFTLGIQMHSPLVLKSGISFESPSNTRTPVSLHSSLCEWVTLPACICYQPCLHQSMSYCQTVMNQNLQAQVPGK